MAERLGAPRFAAFGAAAPFSVLNLLRLRDERAARALPSSQALDGLRGFAMLLVLATHLGIPGQKAGYAAVVLFFVLSGFLITTLLLRSGERHETGRPRLGEFYARRYYRLAPELALFLLLCVPFARLLVDDREVASFFKALLAIVTLTYNWLLISDAGVNGGLGHLWSLSIEEQFYLVWPVALSLLLATTRMRYRVILAIVGSAGIGLMVWRAVSYVDVPYPAMPPGYWNTFMRVDALLLGSALALVRRHHPEINRSGQQILAFASFPALAVIVLLGVESREAQQQFVVPYGLAVALVASVVVISTCLWAPATLLVRWLGCELLVATGILSYGIYLYHQPVIFVVRERLPSVGDHLRYRAPFVVVVTGVLAVASFHTAGAWGRRRRSFVRPPDGQSSAAPI